MLLELAEDVHPGRVFDLFREGDQRGRQLVDEAADPVAFAVAAVDDADLVDGDLVDGVGELFHDFRQHVEHEDLLAFAFGALVDLDHPGEDFQVGFPFFQDRSSFTLSVQLHGFFFRPGGFDHIGHQAFLLQDDPLFFHLLLIFGPRFFACHFRFFFLDDRFPFQFRFFDAQVVLFRFDGLLRHGIVNLHFPFRLDAGGADFLLRFCFGHFRILLGSGFRGFRGGLLFCFRLAGSGAGDGLGGLDLLLGVDLGRFDVLLRLGLGDFCLAARLRFGFFRFCGADRFCPAGFGNDLCRFAAADGIEIAGFVGDVLDFKGIQLQSQLVEVAVRLIDQALGELQAVFVDLFRGEGGQHPAQVAFQGILGNFVNFGQRLAQETLHRVAEGRLIGIDLDVGNRFHIEGNASFGVGIFDGKFDRNGFQRHPGGLLQDGDTNGPPTADQAVADDGAVRELAFPAGEDNHFVGMADQ